MPSACVPLLQVCEIREPRDAGGVEGAIWTAVKCVGRARLETVAVPVSQPLLRSTFDFHFFFTGMSTLLDSEHAQAAFTSYTVA